MHYYGQYLQEGKLYRATTKIFKTIRMVGIPKFNNGTCVPYFTIRQGPGQVGLRTRMHTHTATIATATATPMGFLWICCQSATNLPASCHRLTPVPDRLSLTADDVGAIVNPILLNGHRC